jgi:hypothetical protein
VHIKDSHVQEMDFATKYIVGERTLVHPITTNPIEKTDEAHKKNTVRDTWWMKRVGWIRVKRRRDPLGIAMIK